ncbi:MAG: NnrU family protein [Luminiphilus sp.]|nr:NnrU family protein [Luminiphilus sp.]
MGVDLNLLAGGLLLWSLAHLFRRIAPQSRAKLGRLGRPLIALLLVLSIVLMIRGYGESVATPYWGRQATWVAVNNVLVYLGFYVMAGAWVGARVSGVVRHPQLTAVKAWAVAHLLVNGDVPSLVLFGGMLIWAILEVILINRQEGRPALAKPDYSLSREMVAVTIALSLYGAVGYLHGTLGYPVYG